MLVKVWVGKAAGQAHELVLASLFAGWLKYRSAALKTNAACLHASPNSCLGSGSFDVCLHVPCGHPLVNEQQWFEQLSRHMRADVLLQPE
jgi:hypothetical protein